MLTINKKNLKFNQNILNDFMIDVYNNANRYYVDENNNIIENKYMYIMFIKQFYNILIYSKEELIDLKINITDELEKFYNYDIIKYLKYNFIDDSKLILLRADKFINLIKYIPNNIFNSINIRTSGGTVYDVISSFNYLIKTNNIKNLYGIFSMPINPNNNKNIGGTIFGHYIGEYAIYTFIDNIIKKKIDKDNINIQRLVIFSNNLDMGFANHAIALMFEVDLKHHSYNAILIDTSLYYSGQKKYKVQNKFIDYLIDKFNDYIKEKINPIYKLKIIKDCQPYITFPYVIQKYGDCWLKCIVISLCLNKNNYILDSLKILDFGKKYIKFLDRYYLQEYISYYDKYYNQLNDIYNFNIEKKSNN